ncbi:MAG: Beta-barrel assembly-enhancing protease [bacterium]|nr:Beta-barrel assembly-enhancing protease [bacterium]
MVHYRLKIPADCGDKIYLTAKLNYRKFTPAFTQWVFADYFRFPARYFGDHDALQKDTEAAWPEIPIVEMARDSATLAVGMPETNKPARTSKADPRIWERWNDYGLGLLAQGDLKSAEAAFLLVAQNAPTPADAWINAGIARLHAGDFSRAQQALETALNMESVPFRAHFYYGVTLKARGHYDEALKSLKRTVTRFPRDRVAKIERGELYLQIKDYNRAIIDFEKVLSIDPENVEAYYYLQQAYRAVGDTEKAQRAEKLYERFKASGRSWFEDPQATLAPQVWRERQPIHEHVSAILPANTPPPETNGETFSGKR